MMQKNFLYPGKKVRMISLQQLERMVLQGQVKKIKYKYGYKYQSIKQEGIILNSMVKHCSKILTIENRRLEKSWWDVKEDNYSWQEWMFEDSLKEMIELI
jgi:hypothetical protein